MKSPVAVGGVGGSGTRVVAAIMQTLGYYLGDDLNEPLDNLWYTLLFKRRSVLLEDEQDLQQLIQLFVSRMSENARPSGEAHAVVARLPLADRVDSREWLMRRAETFLAAGTPDRPDRPWGWKEPNTHVLLEKLLKRCPALQYIHVIRHPLDMAFSANQYQLSLWGPIFLEREVTVSPRDSLAYWCAAHRRILRLAAQWPDRIRLLDFDALCAEPERYCRELVESLGVRPGDSALGQVCKMVRLPTSTGRYLQHDLGQFDPADLSYLREIGYELGSSSDSPAGSASRRWRQSLQAGLHFLGRKLP